MSDPVSAARLDGPQPPIIIDLMRADPLADVIVEPSIKGHARAGQTAHAVVAYVDALVAELRRTEADLAVAVHEATRARTESATNRETGGAWRDRALTAETELHSVNRTTHHLDANSCPCEAAAALAELREAALDPEREGQS